VTDAGPVTRLWVWLGSRGARERTPSDAADKLRRSMRVTAKCRYNAAGRLQVQSRFAFFSTTLLSLGLIFIPLMQNTGISLAFAPSVLNMVEIFLAVSVLVYSVIIATARFEVRAAKMTECGDRLKQLIRSMDKDRPAGGAFPQDKLADLQQRYSDVVADCENHNRSDYHLATLEMRDEFFVSGLPRLLTWSSAKASNLFSFFVPLMMLTIELMFITDMIGASDVFVPLLKSPKV
jgi:SMODS and SLOG-associating 2TM effector domain family 5